MAAPAAYAAGAVGAEPFAESRATAAHERDGRAAVSLRASCSDPSEAACHMSLGPQKGSMNAANASER
jgi:hypothetical protein